MSDKAWCADTSPSGEAQCTNPPGHLEDHFDATLKVSWTKTDVCQVPNHGGSLLCTLGSGHSGTAHRTRDGDGVLHTWFGDPRIIRGVPAPLDTTIPDTVRTRVELHRAQTAHDLVVLRAQLDTITVNTAQSKRLRARREQLTAELDAWSYLARVAKNPR